MNITPVIPVPTKGTGPDIPNNSRFEELLPAQNVASTLAELKVVDIPNFVDHFDKASLTAQQVAQIISVAQLEIAWVKRKLAFRLREPKWQDENNPNSKEKLIRMFNSFVQKRIDLIKSVGGTP